MQDESGGDEEMKSLTEQLLYIRENLSVLLIPKKLDPPYQKMDEDDASFIKRGGKK